MSYYPLCLLSELKEGDRKTLEVEGMPILLCQIDGQVYAIENRCSHQNLPLCDGEIEEKAIFCPFHGAKFCLKTGEAQQAPAFEGIQAFTVVEKDGYWCLAI